MNPANPLIRTALAAALTGLATAQEIGRLHLRDDRGGDRNPTVVIDLTDPDIPPAPPLTEILAPDTAAPSDPSAAPAGTTSTEPADTSAADAEPGLVVRVSGFTGTAAKLDPDKISLKAPFPAKTLGAAPAGWTFLRPDAKVPVFEKEVELAPGSAVQLKIRPHVLVPAANGSSVFTVGEPGYDPALEYRQTATIGALLGGSIRQLEQDDRRMTEAIQRLEQLLVSLPAAEP